MGKKAKKTVWRALTLNGHQSDSETSELKPNFSNTNGYQKFSKYTYSSQTLPIKKYQNEIRDKTTSPTNEEQKTTFNEDEYTRITTPRQDVLFKKSYLNKPKTYQTQTSTGTTTTSNSTNTCTPDHQSADGIEGTDLEYESPFMFPNGFIDPNGIFYLNSYEPYPYVFYNAQVCYPDYPASRTKRYSTDSLTESVSPQNEEAGYEQNGEEAPVINQMCDCQHQNGDVTKNGQCIEESRRVKKKRRKLSRSKTEHEEDSSSEDLEPIRIPSSAKKSPKLLSSKMNSPNHCHNGISKASTEKTNESEIKTNGFHSLTDEMMSSEVPSEKKCEDNKNLLFENSTNAVENEDNTEAILTESTSTLSSESEEHGNETENCDVPKHETNACTKLKADAQPFIPRKVYYNEAIPFDPSIQFVNLPPHCIPIPFINPLTDFQSPPLLPAGVRVNCFPQPNPKIMTGYVVSNDSSAKIYNEYPTETFEQNDVEGESNSNVEEVKETEEDVTKSEPKSLPSGKNAIDIAKIVSKLEEAAQQQVSDVKKQPYNKNSRYNPRKTYSTQRPQYGARRENQYFEKQNSYPRRYRKPPQGYRQQKEKPNESSNSQNDIPQLNTENERVRSSPAGQENNELLNYTKACKANIKKEESYPTEKRQESGIQIELRNNSEKVKASNSKECPRFVKNNDGKPEQMRLTQKLAKVPNQWISVSNRKKRKNKIIEEEDVEVEEEIEIFENKDEKLANVDEDDQYESFDVSLLVDVTPNDTKAIEEKQNDAKASVKEEIEIMEQKVPESNILIKEDDKECDLTTEVIESNFNNENKGLKKKNTVSKNETKSKKKSQKVQLKKVMITDPDISIIKIEKIESSECLNESKVELEDLNKPSESKVESVTIEEVQTQTAVIEEVKIESAKLEIEEVEELTLPNDTNESETVEEEVPNLLDEIELAEKVVENILNVVDTSEKKKKKKKQVIKTLMKSQSSESSNTTLNNFGGSYDFLLENSVLEDFEQKTNDECSEDMKKIIQNEIYSSFKEAADFGKGSKIDLFPGYDCLKKKCNIIKAMSFEEICLNVNSHILKFTNTNKESNNLVDVDFSNIVLPDLDAQPSTSKTNFTDDKHISLSGFGTNAIIPVKEKSGKGKKSKNSKSKSKNSQKKNGEAQAADDEQVNGGKGEEFNGKIKLKTNLTTSNSFNYQDIIGSEQPPTINSDSKQTLYPITQAVKEWMIRTRENTPDIEVLKSPNTIYKELFSTDINNDYQIQSKKKKKQIISEESSSANGEEEVTVWSITPQESCEDLLDCWENELSNKSEVTSENKTEVSNVLIKEIGGEVVGIQNGCSMSAYIEEGEDVIEIYDSKYGTNEDFLKIKKEVEQKQKNLNIPKHGYLPYRAICCTIM